MKIGVIGCSSIAESSVIPAIKKSKIVELEILGSRKNKKAKFFAKKFSCKKFGSYEDVLDSNIDAVYISLPIGLHEKWCILAAKKQKHILCEKSLTTSYSSAKKILKVTQKNHVKIMEALMFRFHPSHEKVKELIKSKIKKNFTFFSRYGFPFIPRNNIRFNKKLGGGIFNDAGCYPICASRMLFGKEPISVLANFSIDKKSGIDIKATICLKFSNNEIANMEIGYDLEYENFYDVWGEKGTLRLTRAYNIPSYMRPIIKFRRKLNEREINLKSYNHFELMIDAFCNYCKKNSSINFDVEKDILMQAKIMDAARRSNRLKKNIVI